MTKRHVDLPADAESGVSEFVDLFGDREAYDRWQAGGEVTPAERVRLQGYDPCNATLESEYYAEKDEDRFQESKYLQWLWRQFDATPMADNIAFALRFRQMLADHLFEECGDDCRFFKGITFTYGHNITVGDNVVIHDDVHLDDRGELTIGDRVSVADSTHVYSHDHDVVDQTEVYNYHTVLEDDARLGFDSMVRAGSRVGRNAMLGAKAILQGDVPAHHVAVGTPARSVRVKPGWESVAETVGDRLPDDREQRRLAHTLPETFEEFDEFGRDIEPPDPDGEAASGGGDDAEDADADAGGEGAGTEDDAEEADADGVEADGGRAVDATEE